MAKRRTVLAIPIPADGVEVADVMAVLTGVAPNYDLTRLHVATKEGDYSLVLTAGRRRLRPGALIDAEPLPGLDEDASPWSDSDGSAGVTIAAGGPGPVMATTNGTAPAGEHDWATAE